MKTSKADLLKDAGYGHDVSTALLNLVLNSSVEEGARAIEECGPRELAAIQSMMEVLAKEKAEAALNSKPRHWTLRRGKFKFYGPNPATFGIHTDYMNGKNYLLINLIVCSFEWKA